MADTSTDIPVILSDTERLAAYMQCERSILLGHQSYTVEGMTFTRADLGRVQSVIETLRNRVIAAGSRSVGGIRTIQVIF